MIQSTVNACGSLILQNFMNRFGTQTVAAITTAYRVDTIVPLLLYLARFLFKNARQKKMFN